MSVSKPHPPCFDENEKPMLGEMKWNVHSASSSGSAPKKVHPTPESPLRGRITIVEDQTAKEGK